MNPPQTPLPVPYSLPHDGPKRVLTMHLKRGLIARPAASVLIDGLTFPAAWGTSAYEVPADRPVSVAVQQGSVGQATFVLTPDQTAELVYQGPAQASYAGEIGPPGTVRQRGLGCVIPLLVFAGLLLVALVLFIIYIVTLAL